MDKNDLLDLINDDDLGLLEIEKKAVSATPDDRLTESFMEINEFFAVHNAEPKSGGDIHEHKLASRLKHIRENKEQRDFLSKYDTHNLLKIEKKDLDTINDIFEDDDLDLLSLEENSIFDIKHVSRIHKLSPEFIATRKPCKDFFKYETIFIKCHEGLKTGQYVAGDVGLHTELQPGTLFLLGGLIGYITGSNQITIDERNRVDARLHIIFENGTESGMFLQSLRRSIQKEGGKIIRENILQILDEQDTETGYIYILKSLSDNPRIASTKNLFKIGFSSTIVEERIKNADQDPTYLMAPVSIVSTYRCFNMNPQRFERLIHRFFSDSCLDIEITDNNGKKYTPKEWFIAPIMVIGNVIELIIKGEIVNYSYDKATESVVRIK